MTRRLQGALGAHRSRDATEPSGSGGFTLLEMTIVLLIAMLISLLAMDLLRLWTPLLHHVGIESVVRDRRAALTLIRRDVYAAREVSGPGAGGLWSSSPLEMQTDIGRVRWLVLRPSADQPTVLVRQVLDEGGLPRGNTVLLREVSRWRWRVYGGLIEVEMARASRRRRGSVDAQLTERLERLALMPRGNPRTQW